ncbi:uracil-DNA glycosylase [uncultured Alsobacter sp.]|uniref:uracil-DNA glycosylase n=1 Tax=uncultured Alsobacter sp. TaxID=1748258 RepID=UPI0025F634D5|nr:uracil-DNA glycosylase [uncultured Alsobacter sp.]
MDDLAFDPRQSAAELIRWYVEMGVDAVVDEAPRDRLAEARRPVVQERVTPSPGARPVAAPGDATEEARQLARSAPDLDALRGLLERFEGCALRGTAKSLVFADGNPAGRVMFVGEAPGAEEDRIGKPFVGRSGQLLDRMLAAIGLDRDQVYIANIIPWRPPGNRTPTPQEAAVCQPFIERQIELADPDILVCLGGPSAQALLATKDGILKSRGRWTTYATGTREIRALATLHPAYLLRQPLQKRLAWRDFKTIRAALDATPRPPGPSA